MSKGADKGLGKDNTYPKDNPRDFISLIDKPNVSLVKGIKRKDIENDWKNAKDINKAFHDKICELLDNPNGIEVIRNLNLKCVNWDNFKHSKSKTWDHYTKTLDHDSTNEKILKFNLGDYKSYSYTKAAQECKDIQDSKYDQEISTQLNLALEKLKTELDNWTNLNAQSTAKSIHDSYIDLVRHTLYAFAVFSVERHTQHSAINNKCSSQYQPNESNIINLHKMCLENGLTSWIRKAFQTYAANEFDVGKDTGILTVQGQMGTTLNVTNIHQEHGGALGSINYLCEDSAPKIWIGYVDGDETTVNEYISNSLKDKGSIDCCLHSWHMQKDIYADLQDVINSGIKCWIAIQNPGDLIVSGANTYHTVIHCGKTKSFAINIATLNTENIKILQQKANAQERYKHLHKDKKHKCKMQEWFCGDEFAENLLTLFEKMSSRPQDLPNFECKDNDNNIMNNKLICEDCNHHKKNEDSQCEMCETPRTKKNGQRKRKRSSQISNKSEGAKRQKLDATNWTNTNNGGHNGNDTGRRLRKTTRSRRLRRDKSKTNNQTKQSDKQEADEDDNEDYNMKQSNKKTNDNGDHDEKKEIYDQLTDEGFDPIIVEDLMERVEDQTLKWYKRELANMMPDENRCAKLAKRNNCNNASLLDDDSIYPDLFIQQARNMKIPPYDTNKDPNFHIYQNRRTQKNRKKTKKRKNRKTKKNKTQCNQCNEFFSNIGVHWSRSTDCSKPITKPRSLISQIASAENGENSHNDNDNDMDIDTPITSENDDNSHNDNDGDNDNQQIDMDIDTPITSTETDNSNNTTIPPRRYNRLPDKDISKLHKKFANMTKATLPHIPTTKKKAQRIPGSRNKVIMETLNKEIPALFIYHYSDKKKEIIDRYICLHETCTKDDITSKHMLRHHESHSDTKRWSCPHCDKKFGGERHLKQHISSYHKKNLICPICQESRRSMRTLRDHYKSKHKGVAFPIIKQEPNEEKKRTSIPTPKELASMQARQLKEICNDFDLSQNGKKNELITRINEYIRNLTKDIPPFVADQDSKVNYFYKYLQTRF